ncbi:MFS transporter [Chitinophaga lutea]
MQTKERVFSRYQVFLIVILALLQFTVVLDFMVMSPLGEILMPKLQINSQQFGLVVSAYAISAGLSGVLAAGFADRFDRKKMMLVFYIGFTAGTFLCAIATNYWFLVAARIVTGIFGGVISAIGMAIIADIFVPQVRGRVIGFVQMAFALSQILGVPLGWELANRMHWHAPFWMIGGLAVLLGIVIAIFMRPVDAHLKGRVDKNAFHHLLHTLRNPAYTFAFCTTILMSIGGYMLMPFGSTFSRHNMGLSQTDVTYLYMGAGLATFFFAPLLGRLADKLGKIRVFLAASVVAGVMVVVYTRLGITPLWIAIVINCVMMIGVFGRMIPAQAIMTSLPSMQDRGAFMSINTSVQQLAGGVAAAAAGAIVSVDPGGHVHHYPVVGYVIIAGFVITGFMMHKLNQRVLQKTPPPAKDMAVAS